MSETSPIPEVYSLDSLPVTSRRKMNQNFRIVAAALRVRELATGDRSMTFSEHIRAGIAAAKARRARAAAGLPPDDLEPFS